MWGGVQVSALISRRRHGIAKTGCVADAILLGLPGLGSTEAPQPGPGLQLGAGIVTGRLGRPITFLAAVAGGADVDDEGVSSQQNQGLGPMSPGGQSVHDGFWLT